MLRGTQAGAEERGNPHGLQTDEAPDDEGFTPLTAEQADEWRARQPQTSVWRVVVWQGVLLLLALVLTAPLALVWGQPLWLLSVGYGGLCVLLPSALMAYGLTYSRGARRPGGKATAAASMRQMLFWEGVKLLLAIAMLVLAPSLIPGVSWPALLIGLIVVLKAYWIALWMQKRAVV